MAAAGSDGSVVGALGRALPELRTSERPPDKIAYARDLWPRHHIAVRAGRVADHKPAAIAWPRDPAETSALVRWCADEGVSIVPYGAGSGVCGAVLPTDKTLVVDVKRMNAVRHIDTERGFIEVEAGAMGIRLEEDLQALGHTVGHFPSSILCSTVGGWVAARGAGQCSGLYGKIEDMVASIECIDGRGELATLRRRTEGVDVTPLVTGSEGVLGVITAATLRLHPAPEQRCFAAFSFTSMKRGYDAIRRMYQSGLRPAVCRLYDPFDSMMARRGAAKASKMQHAHDGAESTPKKKRRFPVIGSGNAVLRKLLEVPGAINATIEALGSRAFGGSMLVLVFEGEPERCGTEVEAARRLALSMGAKDLGEGPARHWLAHRYAVSYRQAPMFMMGAFVDTMEVAAPWSCFDALYEGVKAALGEHVMVMAHMSHAYPDGCSIYFTFAASAPDDAACERRYDAAWRAALQAASAAGGTLSHHHGVGRSKAPAMPLELGTGIDVVRALRAAVDPAGIFNPGNLVPDGDAPRTQLPTAPMTPRIDAESQLVEVAGSHSLSEVENALAQRGWSLGRNRDAASGDTSIAGWIAAGAPGAPDPWLDPVDKLVSGYSVELPSGAALHIRPCPRRAVGPDLYALFHGSQVGRIHTAQLRARAAPASSLPCGIDRNPAVDDAEQRWIRRCLDAVRFV